MGKDLRTKRLEWIDTAKVLTMFLVIIGHCNYYRIATPFGGIYYVNQSYESSIVYNFLTWIITFIYSFHMPLFMALSGMCFTFTRNELLSLRSLIKNKAIRLLLPFIAVSILLSIPLKYFTGYWDSSSNILSDVVCGQLLLMGNSHLWFVVSLFWIFLLFYYIEKKHISGKMLWSGLLIVSWVGFYIDAKCNFLGLPGAMKHLLFFTIGYHSLQWLNNYQSSDSKRLSLYFAVMFFVIGAYGFMLRYYSHILILKLLKPILFIVFALSGIFLFCILSKYIQSKLQTKEKWLSIFKRNTYELYLYSDPFNYLIIALCWDVLNSHILIDNKFSLLVFLLRFVGTTFMAFVLIKIVAFLKIKRITQLLKLQ